MRKVLLVIGILSVLAGGSIFYLTANTRQKAVSEFDVGGYIIDELQEESSEEAVNTQYYFNGGEPYSENKYANTVSFKTIDGSKAIVSRDSFVHFNDSAKQAFTKSVLFDADALDDVALSYYSVMDGTKLRREADGYHVNNNGEDMVLKNFVWKISDSDYMVVSDTIDFVSGDDNRQQFTDYVQVKYKDSGIVYIITQQGTYSTISSGAYLELANGIRIYLGSKNVSDGDEKKMNLTDMVINSEDNIELSPDEEYKNEEVKEPKIVVEANDGEDGEDGAPGEAGKAGTAGTKGIEGEAGEEGAEGDEGSSGSDGSTGKAGSAGTNGVNGANGTLGYTGSTGNPGDPGQEGDPGDPGKNATTAGVTYSEEKIPKFHLTEFNVDSYKCDGKISFEQRTTDPNEPLIYTDTINVRIIESESGRTVYDYTPGDGKIILNAFDIETNTLSPSTNYTLIVNAKYKTASDTDYQKDVFTKYFVTSSIGLTLEQKSVTDTSFTGNLINIDDDNVSTLSVRLYDDKKEILRDTTGKQLFLKPTSATISQTYDENTGIFQIRTASGSELNPGEATPLFNGLLQHNTDYYAQIAVATTVDQTKSTFTFPLVPFRTLKMVPELEAPYVTLAGSENSFIASARYISDPDNGILSYRYELFVATDITEVGGATSVTAKPIFTVNSNNTSPIKIPIDGKTVKEDVNYRVRLVAVFDNNEAIVEYPSSFSDVVCFRSSELWPSIVNDTQIITCSTIEGIMNISDNSFVIPREMGNGLYIYLKPNYPMHKLVGTTIQDWEEEVLIGKLEDLSQYSGLTSFSIPYKAQGLKYNTKYSVIVRAARMSEGGTIKDNVTVGSVSLTTRDYKYDVASPSDCGYIPLQINAISADSTREQAFLQYVFFSSGVWSAEKDVQSTIDGVGSMKHFSSKAMEYVKFELQYNDGTQIRTIGYTDPIFLQGGYSNPDDYRFVKDPATAVRTKIYSEDDIDPDAIPQDIKDKCIAETFGVKLTAGSFHNSDKPTEYLDYDKITEKIKALEATLIIHPVVYDYTYISGNGTQTWWKTNSSKADDNSDCNKILCTDDVKVALKMAPPSYKILSDSPFKTNVLSIKDARINKDAGKYTSANSNYKDTLVNEWNIRNESTAACIEISGPQDGELWRYATKVQYKVFASADDLKTDPGHPIAQSGFIDVEGGKLPMWTYFMDAGDSMTRGTTFYVTVSAQLDTARVPGTEGKIYPDDFRDTPISSIKDVDTTYKTYGGYIWNGGNGFCLDRQKPELRVAQWDGTYGVDDETITYLVDLNDPDNAVVQSSGTPKIYLDDVETTNITYGNNTDAESNIVFKKKLTITTKKQAEIPSLHYCVTSTSPETILKFDEKTSSILSGKQLQLVTSADATLKSELGIDDDSCVMVSDSSTTESTQKLSIKFWYQAAINKDLDRVDVTITGYNDATPTEKVVEDFTFVDASPSELSQISYGYHKCADNKEYHSATVALDIIKEDKLVKFGSLDKMQVTVKAYHDTGKFGLSYVKDNSYYASQNKEGKYVNTAHSEANYSEAICSTGNTVDPKPVVYGASEVSLRYSYKDGTAVQYSTSKSGFSTEGLNYVPRESEQLNIDGSHKLNPLKTILPDYKTTVTPGYSLANMQFTLDGGKGTLKNCTSAGDYNGKMIVIFYAEGGLGGISETFAGNSSLKFVSFTESDLNAGNNWTALTQIPASGDPILKGGTKYSYRAFGYAGSSGWKLLSTFNGSATKVTGKDFTTDPEIDVHFRGTKWVEYRTTKDDIKTIRVYYEVKQAFYKDIDRCLQNTSKLVITQDPYGTASEAAYNTGIWQAMKDAFPKNGTVPKDTKETYEFYVDTDWSPSLAHIMDGSTKYDFKTNIVYQAGTSIIPKTGKNEDIPETWTHYQKTFGNGSTTIGIVPVVGNDAVKGGTFGVSLQGKDELRIFRRDISGTIKRDQARYTVSLYRFNQTTQGDEFVQSINIPNDPSDSLPIDASGLVKYIKYDECTFVGLTSGEQYRVKVTADWDNNNDGIIDSTGYIGETQYKRIPAQGITFSSLDLDPEKHIAACGGDNLNLVTKVYYKLKINGGERVEEWILEPGGSGSGKKELAGNWYEDPNKPERYNLIVNEMNNTEDTYELLVTLYDSNGNSKSMINYYGKKTGGSILTTFINWLTGN